MVGAAAQWPTVSATRDENGSSSGKGGGSKWDPHHKRKRGSGDVAWQPAEQYAEETPDFRVLAEKYPSFREYVRYRGGPKGSGWASIDWTDYNATRELTRVLLHHEHGVNWSLPPEHLCPAVTNRANYIRWIADLTAMTMRMIDGAWDRDRDGDGDGDGSTMEEDDGRSSLDGGGGGYGGVRGLDIGTGANCIYPLLGASIHGWHFVGTDTSERALEAARANVAANPHLNALIEVRKADAGVPACRATKMRSSRKGGEEDQDQREREGEWGGPCPWPGSVVCSSGRGGPNVGDGDGDGTGILTATHDLPSEGEKGEGERDDALKKVSRKGEDDAGGLMTLSSAPVRMELSELKEREDDERGGKERGEEETEGEAIDQIGRERERDGCDSGATADDGVDCGRRYGSNGGDGVDGGDDGDDGGVDEGSGGIEPPRRMAVVELNPQEEWRWQLRKTMNCVHPSPSNENGRDASSSFYTSRESQHSLITHYDDGAEDYQRVQGKKKMKYHASETMAAASRGVNGGGGGGARVNGGGGGGGGAGGEGEGKQVGNKKFARSGHGDGGQVIPASDGNGDEGEERYGAEGGDEGREGHGDGGQNQLRGGDDNVEGDVEERVECGRCKVGVCGMKLGHIFLGVVGEDECFDFCLCNPPFFESIELAKANPKTACGGTFEEMVCEGGEYAFIRGMIGESLILRRQIRWYTVMVGRKTDLKSLIALLRNLKVPQLRTTEFRQGRTMRWGLAWSFLELPRANHVHQPLWIRERIVRQQQRQQQPFLSSSSAKKDATKRTNWLQQQQQQQRRVPKISFALEGLGQKVTAFTVLQLLTTELRKRGALCKMDVHSFQITGSIPGQSSSSDIRAEIGPQLPQQGSKSQVVVRGTNRSNVDTRAEFGPRLSQQDSSFDKSQVVCLNPTSTRSDVDIRAEIGPQLPQQDSESQVVVCGTNRSNVGVRGEIGPQLPKQDSSFDKSQVVCLIPTSTRSNVDIQAEIGPQLPQQDSESQVVVCGTNRSNVDVRGEIGPQLPKKDSSFDKSQVVCLIPTSSRSNVDIRAEIGPQLPQQDSESQVVVSGSNRSNDDRRAEIGPQLPQQDSSFDKLQVVCTISTLTRSNDDKREEIGPQLPQQVGSFDKLEVADSMLGSNRRNDRQEEIGPRLPQQGSSFHESEIVAATAPTIPIPVQASAFSSAVASQQREEELRESNGGGGSCRAGLSFFVKIMEQSKGAVLISACLAKGSVCTDEIELGFHYLFGEMEDTLRTQVLLQRR
ncbi:hypothetical protein CBR_g23939 [Chara braunii]|uniref:U6 small nuclear RNA (adenine-(43)-N(6))-methyltransferase n=1 Tax=Chara braunii TaxID=69332 RepID=A0A388L5H6_CHABU|nr:hypothetical protein CBR_g23939 [Chara braunii]|eukprot:GBG77492.1 hypothetical protein CBR_g23939 [Chara braunii]